MPRDLGLDDVVSQYPEAAQELAELHEANVALQRELDEANTRARVNWDAAKELTDQLMTCRANLAAALAELREALEKDK